MSETLLKLLLSELDTVRVICKKANCGTVVEVPLHKLPSVRECPSCGASFLLAPGQSGFLPFLSAIRDIVDLKDRVELGFVLLQKPATFVRVSP